ncbi:sulfotransferase family 2 domain-containing protein [Mangrovicoccus sp. HB161399]|uniref:sulfotransferase family 2 domain-containing protein n=1 Tax=Mangrovicoccus sp. HB161399 TaxID=2720392 RepID=UPI0015575951|nr:sulfotransferase family 2 domain-containing protein [Mangrovicoccus sp. HB161399]
MVKAPPGRTAPRGALGQIAARLGAAPAQLDYLVNPDPLRRIAYVETPKVACTAVKAFMQDRAGGRKDGDVHDRATSPLPVLSAMPPSTRRATLSGRWQRFSFTRNPYSRLLSGYLDKIVANDWERARHLPRLGFAPDARPSLAEFLGALARIPEPQRDIHFALQSRLLCLGDIGYGFLGAFESFETDFAEMKRRLYGDASGGSYAAIGKRHATGAAEKLAAQFGPRETALAAELYAADFELLGYPRKLADAALPPERSAPPGVSAHLAARREGLPSPVAGPKAFADALEDRVRAGSLHPLRAAELAARAGAEVQAGAGRSSRITE